MDNEWSPVRGTFSVVQKLYISKQTLTKPNFTKQTKESNNVKPIKTKASLTKLYQTRYAHDL